MRKILQAFKKLFRKCPHKEKAYLCDPKKAISCSKEGCWEIYKGPCKCTMKKKYAKTDADGKPIIAQDMDLWNEEYYEYLISMHDQTNGNI